MKGRVELEPYPAGGQRYVDVFPIDGADDKVSLWLTDGWVSATTQMKASEARELAELIFGVVAEIEDDGERGS